MSSSWPGGGDYLTAVTVERCLRLPPAVMQSSVARRRKRPGEKMGSPLSYSGSFAIVFRFDANGSSHAVRCFTRPQAELLHRYRCIEEHLSRVDLPYFSRFELIPEGILVKDAWRPVLVMDWAPGDKFDAYIGSHRKNPTALRKLAGDIVTMARELESSGIAHGDLQHGNIFVGPEGIRLVDYDGMFVPSLREKGATEVGLPDYQHPRRNRSFYNARLDRFSVLVICTALMAIAADPELGDDVEDGLLFTQHDLGDPSASGLFRSLTTHADRAVREYARLLVKACGCEPDEVAPPPLPSEVDAVAAQVLSGNVEAIRKALSDTRSRVEELERSVAPIAVSEATLALERRRLESRRSEIERDHAASLDELNAAHDALEQKIHEDIKRSKTREIVEVALLESQSLRSDADSGAGEESLHRCRSRHEASRKQRQAGLAGLRHERLLKKRELEARRDAEFRRLEVALDGHAGSEVGLRRSASELVQARMNLMAAEAQAALLGMTSGLGTLSPTRRETTEAALPGMRSRLFMKQVPVEARAAVPGTSEVRCSACGKACEDEKNLKVCKGGCGRVCRDCTTIVWGDAYCRKCSAPARCGHWEVTAKTRSCSFNGHTMCSYCATSRVSCPECKGVFCRFHAVRCAVGGEATCPLCVVLPEKCCRRHAVE